MVTPAWAPPSSSSSPSRSSSSSSSDPVPQAPSRQRSTRHGEPSCRGDIVDAEHGGAAFVGHHAGGNGPGLASDASRRQAPDEVLARDCRGTRAADRRSRRAGAAARGCARRSCRSRCPGPARSGPRTLRRRRRGRAAPPGTPYVVDDVVVARVLLHRAGLAEHVHQAAVVPAVGGEDGHPGVSSEGPDVVDVGRAGLERGLGDVELGGVDGDGRAGAASPRTTGTTRRSSSSPGPGPPRGGSTRPHVEDRRALVGQPPAWATAAASSSNPPPSENESGVTLTTPMIANGAMCIMTVTNA